MTEIAKEDIHAVVDNAIDQIQREMEAWPGKYFYSHSAAMLERDREIDILITVTPKHLHERYKNEGEEA